MYTAKQKKIAEEAQEPVRNIGNTWRIILGSDFEAYAKQLDFFFVANNVTNSKKKKAILLTNRPVETYELAKNLVVPTKLKEDTLTYEEPVARLQKQLKPQKSALVVKYEFDNRARNTWETVIY